MKKFLIRIVLFALPLAMFAGFVFMIEGGYSDTFYLRFTTPEQTSLILGTSRAAQGIVPDVLASRINAGHSIFNYAFTVAHSPFGEVYLSSVKKKLSEDGKGGIFIVAVDPWSLSTSTASTELNFPERDQFLGRMSSVTGNPNLEYLLNFYADPYYKIILRRLKPSQTRLHENGWLEVNVKMDSVHVRSRTERKLTEYRNTNAEHGGFSLARYEALRETIEYLKSRGEVYLVRLPIHPKMEALEKEFMPDFHERMALLTDLTDVPYLDMTLRAQDYLYTDGSHLFKKSAIKASEQIASWIGGQTSGLTKKKENRHNY
jgi:hypothetical protein